MTNKLKKNRDAIILYIILWYTFNCMEHKEYSSKIGFDFRHTHPNVNLPHLLYLNAPYIIRKILIVHGHVDLNLDRSTVFTPVTIDIWYQFNIKESTRKIKIKKKLAQCTEVVNILKPYLCILSPYFISNRMVYATLSTCRLQLHIQYD